MAITAHNTASGNGLVLPYSFTGKERDSETGFSYFGARYYDSDLSGLFLSVDPMAEVSSFEKRSGLLRTSSSLRTPQELVPYCAWNPIVYIDSNGMEITDWPKIGRCAKGAMNIVSGTITAIGGIVIRAGVRAFTGGVAAPIGAIVVGTGAYEITEGIHNIANALSGATKSSDPKYTTPIGAVTNITTVDFVTSVLVGYGSTAVTALGKATTAQQLQYLFY